MDARSPKSRTARSFAAGFTGTPAICCDSSGSCPHLDGLPEHDHLAGLRASSPPRRSWCVWAGEAQLTDAECSQVPAQRPARVCRFRFRLTVVLLRRPLFSRPAARLPGLAPTVPGGLPTWGRGACCAGVASHAAICHDLQRGETQITKKGKCRSVAGLTVSRARSTIGLVLPVWAGTIRRGRPVQERRARQALLMLCLLLASCATGPASSDRPAAPPPLTREDLLWLNRVTD